MAAPSFDVESIPLDGIFVVGKRRAVNEGAVARLAESIEKLGLRTPITIRVDKDLPDPDTGEVMGGYVLVAGHHRLEAYRKLGKKQIPAIVRDCDEVDARLWEIAENLHRADLTALEHDEQVEEWRRLTASKVFQPGTPKGGEQKSDKGVRKTAKQFNLSPQAVLRAEKVANLSPDAKEAAKETGLDSNRTALLEAAKAPKAQQAAVIRDYAEKKKADRNKLDGDIKARAAREVASVLAEYVPGEWWDALKSNLYAAGAANIANELSNITGQSIMDGRYGDDEPEMPPFLRRA